MSDVVDWSDLPVELWPIIAERLKPRIELLRFRNVCPLWRSHLPSSLHNTPPPPNLFPLPLCSNAPSAFLVYSTVYLLKPPAMSSSTPSSSLRGCLVKVEECEASNRMLIRNPVTSRRVNSKSCTLFEFDMIEVKKSYFFRYIQGSGSIYGLKKVMVLNGCEVVVISDKGRLGYARAGDRKLRELGCEDSVFDDCFVYKGETYVVENSGCVFRVSLCFSDIKMVKISSDLGGLCGGRKHLVESCGELYVVDRYYDEASKQEVMFDFRIFGRRGRRRRFQSGELKVVEFKVYKMEFELGRWVEVKRLVDDHAIFVANDCCFAVSAKEVQGSKGNCVYFTDENDVNLALRDITRPESFVFDLEDRSIQKLGSSEMFWPPPNEIVSSLD